MSFDHSKMPDIKPGPKQLEWLKSLRENPDRQYRGYLGKKKANEFYKACCLGEYGLITGVCEWRQIADESTLIVRINNHIISDTTLASVNLQVGLYNSNGNPFNLRAEDGTLLIALSSMNDNRNTWPEIADHVEKYFKYYFNKSI